MKLVIMAILLLVCSCQKAVEASNVKEASQSASSQKSELSEPNPVKSYRDFLAKIPKTADASLIAKLPFVFKEQKIIASNISFTYVSLYGNWDKSDGHYFVNVTFKDHDKDVTATISPHIFDQTVFNQIHSSNKFNVTLSFNDSSIDVFPKGIYITKIEPVVSGESLNPREICFKKDELQCGSWSGRETSKCVQAINVLSYTDNTVDYPPTVSVDLTNESYLSCTD